ncbi:FAD-binding oxidoreductase [Alkalicaulis satelles]|uniref:D-lactate dehydrogenase (cytochrome) n=1 Tax=Alkalicaulis satelles TaxID=2609175 RepID=A0A5M6ZI76_9PROT|nr:FAD-binding oxidoreductase [Alkalicaulis satelles]KAA5803514.1 FAD-binding oxidoreductase [Alkalicaulis satelles]
MTRPAPAVQSLAETLASIVGPDHVRSDDAARALYSQDVWRQGAQVDLVASPADEAECAAVVRACAEAGAPVYPRGGGMSYTAGYLADRPGGVCLDTVRMNRVLEISEAGMYVRVEAGCTWKTLYEALAAKGLRTPFWGPLSGISSTIGGGVSQNNAFFGAGVYGPTSDSVLSIAAALPDGSILRTGTASAETAKGPGRPFLRHYGPDLTGLFCGDAGALGVKTQITLRLIPAPAHERWASFSYPSREACAEALASLGRTGLACELFAFDPGLTAVRMKRASLMSDAKTLGKVVTGQKNLVKGLAEGAKMALAGRQFLGEADFNLHLVTESHSKTGAEDALRQLTQLAERAGGRSVEPTIPKVIRAQPFTPLNNMIGPAAERWVPVHGIVAMDDGPACWAEIEALFAGLKPRFDAHGVTTGFLVTTLSNTGFLVEPVFLWPDRLFALHEASVEAGYLKSLTPRAPDPDATRLVAEAREAVVDIFSGYGAAHFQAGRTYPLARTRSAPALALLKAVKAALDPQNIINPGALGLGELS